MNDPSVVSLNPQVAREPDRIHVFLKDCRVELSVGHHPDERLKTQPLIVDLEVEAALPHRYQDLAERNLDHVIDYDHFLGFIRNELPRMGHITLLETVAEQIIDFCFRDRRIHRVCVRIEKPEIYGGAARPGIEVRRTRAAGAS